jgi:hypothetical protein
MGPRVESGNPSSPFRALVVDDVNKLAFQISDNTVWVLTSISPTWSQIGPGAASSGSIVTAQTDSDIVHGTPVYSTSGSHFEVSQASGLPQADVIGLSTASTSSGLTASIQTQDVLELTTDQWDVVTGDVGGLVSGTTYSLDGSAPGMLRSTPPSKPSETHDTLVGVAVTSTKMNIKPRQAIEF